MSQVGNDMLFQQFLVATDGVDCTGKITCGLEFCNGSMVKVMNIFKAEDSIRIERSSHSLHVPSCELCTHKKSSAVQDSTTRRDSGAVSKKNKFKKFVHKRRENGESKSHVLINPTATTLYT